MVCTKVLQELVDVHSSIAVGGRVCTVVLQKMAGVHSGISRGGKDV